MAPTRKNLKSKKAKLSLRKKGGKKSIKRVGRKAAKKTTKKRKVGGNQKLNPEQLSTLTRNCEQGGESCKRHARSLYSQNCAKNDLSRTVINKVKSVVNKERRRIPTIYKYSESEECKKLEYAAAKGKLLNEEERKKEEDKEKHDENFGDMIDDAEYAVKMTSEEAAELEKQSKEGSE